jgi:hypothetical protein
MGQVVIRKGTDSTNEYDAWGGGGGKKPMHYAVVTVNATAMKTGTLRTSGRGEPAPQPTQIVYAIPMEQPVDSTHISLPTPAPVSAPGQQCDCGEHAATVHCNECDRNFCDACNTDGHKPGAKKDHVRVPIPVYCTYFSPPADAAEYAAVYVGADASGTTRASTLPHYDLATGGNHNQNNVYDKWGGAGAGVGAAGAGGGGKKTASRRKYVNLPEQNELFQDQIAGVGAGAISASSVGGNSGKKVTMQRKYVNLPEQE